MQLPFNFIYDEAGMRKKEKQKQKSQQKQAEPVKNHVRFTFHQGPWAHTWPQSTEGAPEISSRARLAVEFLAPRVGIAPRVSPGPGTWDFKPRHSLL